MKVLKSRYTFRNVRLFVLILCSIFSGCKKLVDVDAPATKVTATSVFEDNATAAAILTGVYAKISNTAYNSITFSIPSLSIYAGLSADELALWQGAFNTNVTVLQKQYYYFTNSLFNTPDGQYGGEFWTSFYNLIYTCNSVIDGLNNPNSLTPSIKQQLAGEAKFVRALCYFYLINLYGDAPLVLGTDFKTNSLVSRTSKSTVYEQIVEDLKDAQGLLSDNYLDASLLKTTIERVRPTKWAATALLSRVYLYTEDWADAETQATAIIDNKTLYDTVSLNKVFLSNSKESIWQLQPVITGWNTQDARLFIIPATGFNVNTSNAVYLSNSLYNTFETGDNRKSIWINKVTLSGTTYYYPTKYKSATLNASVTEYQMILRLGEQYLIRAEARAHQNKLMGLNSAFSDLNIIRNRASLPPSIATSQTDLLAAIQHERQVELFTELGQRWLDLKRTNQVDAVMTIVTPQKNNGASWKSSQQLYPLPYTEIDRDPNLIQNLGY